MLLFAGESRCARKREVLSVSRIQRKEHKTPHLQMLGISFVMLRACCGRRWARIACNGASLFLIKCPSESFVSISHNKSTATPLLHNSQHPNIFLAPSQLDVENWPLCCAHNILYRDTCSSSVSSIYLMVKCDIFGWRAVEQGVCSRKSMRGLLGQVPATASKVCRLVCDGDRTQGSPADASCAYSSRFLLKKN